MQKNFVSKTTKKSGAKKRNNKKKTKPTRIEKQIMIVTLMMIQRWDSFRTFSLSIRPYYVIDSGEIVVAEGDNGTRRASLSATISFGEPNVSQPLWNFVRAQNPSSLRSDISLSFTISVVLLKGNFDRHAHRTQTATHSAISWCPFHSMESNIVQWPRFDLSQRLIRLMCACK